MNIKDNKFQFYIFLLINFLVLTLVQLFRNVISIDAMEAISWGEMLDIGTNKHPPFSGWIMSGFYHLFGQADIVAYFLGSLCLLIGYMFIYKLAKFFLSDEKAMAASMILSSCYYYTYILLLDNFNCNFVSMALYPAIVYYFYKSVKGEKTKDWLLFGILSGIAVLTKYQAVFIFAALFLYMMLFERQQFKKRGMYISIFVGSVIILPHIIWLFKTDFFSLIYMTDRADIGAHNTPQMLIKYGRIVFPIKFLLDQILSIGTCILVYLLTAFQAKNIHCVKDEISKSDKWFILIITLIPNILQACTAIITNNRVQGIWGSIFVCFAGILLFAIFPVKFNDKTFKYFVKLAYTFLIIWALGLFIFVQLQTKRIISYPYQQIMPEFNKIWDKSTNNSPFKFVGGNIKYVFQFHVYNERHPKAILETFGHKSPWINSKEVLNSGLLVVAESEEEIPDRVREFNPLLPETYEIKPCEYKFEVKNVLGKTREYKFYYTVIPPQKND